jgi:hypothetical protein
MQLAALIVAVDLLRDPSWFQGNESVTPRQRFPTVQRTRTLSAVNA